MLHQLSKLNGKTKRRVGRAGQKGKTSGRGHKGQRSRSGANIRPIIRDEIQKIPKRRGHNKNRARTVREDKVVRSVTTFKIDKYFNDKDIVSPAILVKRGIVKRFKGKAPKVKIILNGDIKKSIIFKKCFVSKNGRDAIEKAGGKIFI